MYEKEFIGTGISIRNDVVN